MKADKRRLGAALDQPSGVRFYLFHGPDEAGSRALADRLLAGSGREKSPLIARDLKSDPARLPDEASAISLFGDEPLLWIEPANDDIIAAVTALLDAPSVSHPTVAIAGNLRKTNKLLKLVEPHKQTLSHVSYAPEGRDFERLLEEMARKEGLIPEPNILSRFARSVGQSRAIAAQELRKIAIYVGAEPSDPKPLSHDVIDAIGIDQADETLFAIGDAALAGDIEGVAGTLDQSNLDPIPLLRAIQRRIAMLGPLQAQVASGRAPGQVVANAGRAIFWKDKGLVETMLQRWPAPRLATLADRIGALERRILLGKAPADALMAEELLAIARAARGAGRR